MSFLGEIILKLSDILISLHIKDIKKYEPLVIVLLVIAIIVAIISGANVSKGKGTDGSESEPVMTENIMISNIGDICSQIENSFSSLGFEKGAITTEKTTYDTSTMSAEIYDFRLGNKVYLFQDRDTEKYTALFVPIHFSMNINQTFTFDKQTIKDVVGYARIKIYDIDSQDDFKYEVVYYLSAQYFTSEELLYKHLCGNGYIVEEIALAQ